MSFSTHKIIFGELFRLKLYTSNYEDNLLLKLFNKLLYKLKISFYCCLSLVVNTTCMFHSFCLFLNPMSDRFGEKNTRLCGYFSKDYCRPLKMNDILSKANGLTNCKKPFDCSCQSVWAMLRYMLCCWCSRSICKQSTSYSFGTKSTSQF